MEITGSTAKPGPGPGPDGEPEIVLESRFLGIDHGPYSHRCDRWHPATQALREPQAPPFTLPDLDGRLHSLEEWRDRKKLLVALSTW